MLLLCCVPWLITVFLSCFRDVKCGLLHCMHLNERLEFGMESVSKVSHSFLKGKEGVIPCRVALVDMGLDMVDPGLAPDGAKCDRGKVGPAAAVVVDFALVFLFPSFSFPFCRSLFPLSTYLPLIISFLSFFIDLFIS